MFEHLRDPDPPEVRDETRQAVAARAGRIRRRGQLTRAALALVVVVAAAGAGLTAGRRGPDETATVEVADGAQVCCGTIEGTVRDSAGPLGGIAVSLLVLGPAPTPEDPSPWKVRARATTDGAGRVTFTDIEAGSYAVRAEDRQDPLLKVVRHQPAFFAGAPVLSRATPLALAPGGTVPFDLVLERSPTTTITGDVRESAQHFPIAGITVKLFLDRELTRETVTDATGSYDLGGVAPGQYTLEFVDGKGPERTGGRAFRSIWYAGPDKPEGSFTSVPFTVGSGNVTADITLVR